MLKKLIKISYVLFASLFGLLMLIYLLFNTYTFQNYLVGRLTGYLNKTFHTNITIGEINYDGWTFFSLREVKFGDQKNDTTFYAGRVQFNIVGLKIDSTHFILNDIVLDEGLCRIATYKDGTYSLDVVNLFYDPNDTTPSDPNAPPFILELNNFECMDTRFRLIDSSAEFYPTGFDYNRICIDDINFRSKHVKIRSDSVMLDIKNLNCRERSGFKIERMKAYATICNKTIELKNLDLVTPNSHIRDYISLNSKSWDDYDDFLNKVVFRANLKETELDIKDVAFFIPDFSQYKIKAKVSVSGKGPVSNLNLKNMVLSVGKDTKIAGKMRLLGLPNIEETFMDIQLDYASTICAELEEMIATDLPQQFADLGKVEYNGNYTGFYKDFVSYGTIQTAFGSAETDLNMKLNKQTMMSEYSGKISMNSFQLGAYLKNNDMGIVDMTANIKGRGFDLKSLNTDFDINLNAINYKNYTYRNIDLAGKIIQKDLKIDFAVADSNLELHAKVEADLGGVYTHLLLKGQLENANLLELNLNSEKISMSTGIETDFYFKDLNDYHGMAMINELSYDKGAYTYRINQLKLEAENDEEELLLINGDFIHGKIKGEINLDALYDQVKYWTLCLGKSYFNPIPAKSAEQRFDMDINILTLSSISPLLFPDFSATNIELQGFVISSKNAYELEGYIGNLKYQEWNLNQATFKITEENTRQGNLLFGFRSFGRNDTMLISEFVMKADAVQDKWNLEYQIQDSLSIVQGNFVHEVLFEPNDFLITYQPSWIKSGNSRWEIQEGKSIQLNSESVLFENLHLENQKQKITVDGNYNYDGKNKNLSIKLEDLDLNTVNQFIRKMGVKLGGLANGYLVYKNMGSKDVLMANIKSTDLAFDNDTIGDYNVSIGYREKDEDLLIDFSSVKGKINNLKGTGSYDISRKYLDLNIDFNNSKINAFQAFVKDYVKLNEGDAKLNAKLSGPINKLSLDGQLQLNNVKLKIEYLQTNYTIKKAEFNFNDNLIKVVPFLLSDVNGQTAKVTGQITHTGFDKLQYDFHMDDFKSFQVMNTIAKDNDLFYGNAYATGKFIMKGSSSDLAMYIDATTEKGTKITINPFGASSETGESYIHFVSHDTVQLIKGNGKGSDFGMGVYMNITANENAVIQVIFDAKSDDRIKAKGVGKLKMDYLPDGNFFVRGEYELIEGEYRFSAMNVVAKKFDLKRGSKIIWAGDPLQGKMDIAGIYKLKTTVNQIINMTTAPDPNVRVPVECIINIKGIVEKPDFTFDLNFPDMQNNLTGTAASELNAVVANFRREPDMMNQQMLFLLISGSFVPITNSYNTASNSFGTQTVSDLLSKQAGGIIGKAIPNLDVSIDLLNSSDPTKSRTVLLGVSKRFLDNRLEVQTSYAMDQTQSNLAAIYSLKKNGSTKAKVFNKYGFDALYNRNVMTSGLGLYYRKDFNNFSEFFKKQKGYNY